MTQLNPVVQKLVEQAKGFVDLNQHVGGDNGCMIYTYEGLNQFAELIVRECSDYVHKCIVEDGNEFPMKSVAYRIKEHFGIE
jgi:hypothetical protein